MLVHLWKFSFFQILLSIATQKRPEPCRLFNRISTQMSAIKISLVSINDCRHLTIKINV